MTVAEAKARITHAEFVEWMAWFDLRAEIDKGGAEVLEKYQPGAEETLAAMDAELDRISKRTE